MKKHLNSRRILSFDYNSSTSSNFYINDPFCRAPPQSLTLQSLMTLSPGTSSVVSRKHEPEMKNNFVNVVGLNNYISLLLNRSSKLNEGQLKNKAQVQYFPKINQNIIVISANISYHIEHKRLRSPGKTTNKTNYNKSVYNASNSKSKPVEIYCPRYDKDL